MLNADPMTILEAGLLTILQGLRQCNDMMKLDYGIYAYKFVLYELVNQNFLVYFALLNAHLELILY